MIRHWEDGKDYDGDGVSDFRENLRADTVRVFYDVRFDFVGHVASVTAGAEILTMTHDRSQIHPSMAAQLIANKKNIGRVRDVPMGSYPF